MSDHNISISDIAQKTASAKDITNRKVREIQEITSNLRILSLNALIEAKRAGDAGRGFSVVAEEVKSISQNVELLSSALANELGNEISELEEATTQMAKQSVGNRLIDLSLNAIELIDRNLYERTCDVRWWATDSAIVDAAQEHDTNSCNYAAKRLGVILDSYTVYLDLWLCDMDGNIIANGRPNQYNAVGKNVRNHPWFTHAAMQMTGDEYTADNICNEPILNNAQIATYACGIREDGARNGKLIGVLGIHFDWEPQAMAIINGVRLEAKEKQNFNVMLLDAHHRVIATNHDNLFTNIDDFQPMGKMSGYYQARNGKHIAFHKTPGYETYNGMGWYGVIAEI